MTLERHQAGLQVVVVCICVAMLLDVVGPGKVQGKGTTATLTAFDIREMMPADQSYYSYDGSLTTPPCYQSVVWHVMRNTLTVSPQQLAAFRTLLAEVPFTRPH